MPPPNTATLTVPNDAAAIERAQSQVVAALDEQAYPKASVFAVRLAMHEAISNAFHHGLKDQPGSHINLRYSVGPQEAEITVEDDGPGFDPSAIPDPTLDENLERGSGRGLLLIRAYMAVAEYNAKGNILRMVYKKPKT